MGSFDVSNNVISGTADSAGATASELVAVNTVRDGVMIFNKSTSVSLAVTLVSKFTVAGTVSSATAFASRIALIPPLTTYDVGAKGDTRVLLSTESGTAAWNAVEVDS